MRWRVDGEREFKMYERGFPVGFKAAREVRAHSASVDTAMFFLLPSHDCTHQLGTRLWNNLGQRSTARWAAGAACIPFLS